MHAHLELLVIMRDINPGKSTWSLTNCQVWSGSGAVCLELERKMSAHKRYVHFSNYYVYTTISVKPPSPSYTTYKQIKCI